MEIMYSCACDLTSHVALGPPIINGAATEPPCSVTASLRWIGGIREVRKTKNCYNLVTTTILTDSRPPFCNILFQQSQQQHRQHGYLIHRRTPAPNCALPTHPAVASDKTLTA